jgi:hypothetical protein
MALKQLHNRRACDLRDAAFAHLIQIGTKGAVGKFCYRFVDLLEQSFPSRIGYQATASSNGCSQDGTRIVSQNVLVFHSWVVTDVLKSEHRR